MTVHTRRSSPLERDSMPARLSTALATPIVGYRPEDGHSGSLVLGGEADMFVPARCECRSVHGYQTNATATQIRNT